VPATLRPLMPLLLLVALAGCLEQLGEIPEVFDEPVAPVGCAGACDGPGGALALGVLPDATLATLFAPYEPALGLDLLLIREVVAARAADPAVYPEGDNPFHIRFAVYNLDNPEIAEALADAEDAGVDVQILIEQDQLDPARDWNVMDDYLVARGFELAPDHRQLDDAGRRSADLVGIAGAGLMHLKARLYHWIDPATGAAQHRLVTGSMNPGHLAVHNDETLHYVALPEVVARYQAKYEAVLWGRRLHNAWDDTAAAQVLFTPDAGAQAVDRIAALIDREQEAILVAVFSLRNIQPTTGGPGILDRLVAAHRRGVVVVVVTDRKQSDGVDADGNRLYADDGSEDLLRRAGIPVYEVLNRHTPFNAMHTKYGIFGVSRPVIVTDAANWSRAALGSGSTRPSNHESVLFLDSHRLDGGLTGLRYLGHFLELLHRYGTDGLDGATPTEGPAPGEMLRRLQALAGWPAVEVVFAAHATTAWGEQVHVTGDLDVLGDWTRGGAGWPLDTDGERYPWWHGEPLPLPFGARLEHKLIKRGPGGVTWEPGTNRALTVDPTDRRAGRRDDRSGALIPELRWR
jgi:hypothetical protein